MHEVAMAMSAKYFTSFLLECIHSRMNIIPRCYSVSGPQKLSLRMTSNRSVAKRKDHFPVGLPDIVPLFFRTVALERAFGPPICRSAPVDRHFQSAKFVQIRSIGVEWILGLHGALDRA
jgi:hypothetical protein